MPLIFELSELNFNLNLNIKTITPYFTIFTAFLLVSKLPTLSLKKISVSPKTTVFILLGMGTIFISFLYYTFETLLIFGLIYLILIPASYAMYKNNLKKNISERSNDDHEDVL
jgi:CDP-diacylglycerol--serine O-phosphatidyltransferase